MKVVRINQLYDTDREVHGKGFISIRPVLEKDGMGYSVHKTIIPAGGPYKWHYKNHLETCYCIKGKGILTDIKNNTQHLITKDCVYILDNHDEHTFEALEDVELVSIFNPPVKGNEVHKEDGSYEANSPSIL